MKNSLMIAVVLCLIALDAVAADKYDVKKHYTKSEHMVAMRDGVKLFTIIYSPIDKRSKYPIMLFRTPYSIGPYGVKKFRKKLGPSIHFMRSGFHFVYQDVRGKFNSEGKFEVMKPLKKKPKGPFSTDESTDNFDTIQWALKKVPNNNGRVGQWGISYPGWQTVMGMIDAHPALKASSPQASPADMFIGDDWHHNGAFRLMYTFHWLSRNAAARSGPRKKRGPPIFRYGTPDGYDFFLRLGPLANANRIYLKGRVPTWNEYMREGVYNKYWKDRNALNYLRDIKHPILNVAGWFDAEDFYGPMSIYYTIEKRVKKNKSTLVVGPWRHGGWASQTGESLGDIRFGSKTSEHYQKKIELPFFEWYLKGKKTKPLAEAEVFETGSNQWKSYARWPPRRARIRRLYLRANGKLAFEKPAATPKTGVANEGSDTYVSDPARPVPFSDKVRNTQGHTWMVEDQRFASRRPDVLVYETEPLKKSVLIAGPIIANLRVSTTGTDSDWIVKLIDVYPGNAKNDSPRGKLVKMGGYQMLVAGEVMRGKFRNGFERPEPMKPGQVTKVRFDLRDKYHRFLPGHKIMVQIHSSWFPVIDRNPQKFVNIYKAKASDFQAATQRVYRSAEHASSLRLHVIPEE